MVENTADSIPLPADLIGEDTTSLKKRRWWTVREPIDTKYKCNTEEIFKHLHARRLKNCRYHVYDKHGMHKTMVSASTVSAALKRGNTDLGMWCYANLQVPVPTQQTTKDGRLYYITQYVSNPVTSHWVLDIDKTTASSIRELELLLIHRDCPLPAIAVQTGPHSFHLLYFGLAGMWTLERRLAVACRAGGIDLPKDISLDKTHSLLKEAGIDASYLLQDIRYSKYRVPGSVNWDRPWKNPNEEPFVCIGKYYTKYEPETALAMIDDSVMIKRTESAIKNCRQERLEGRIRELSRMLKDHLGELSDYFGKLIAENWNLLKKGTFRILQTRVAADMGITQPTVSRALRKLIKAGILSEKLGGKYIVGEKAKTYGLGEKLTYPPQEPATYKKGEFNSSFLKDVRRLVALGKSDEEIVAYGLKKQNERPWAARRCLSYFYCAVRLWRKRLSDVGMRYAWTG